MHTDIQHRRRFKNAIFEISGSRHPTLQMLAVIGERAAKVALRSKPWKARSIYVALHCDRYDKHNNGVVRYGISEKLYNAVMQLTRLDAMRGKQPITVFAQGVRQFAVILGRSRCCRYRRCRIHFVSDAGRLYCSSEHARLEANARRRHAAAMRRQGMKLCGCGRWYRKIGNMKRCRKCIERNSA